MKAYKLFRVKNGSLYPLYIYANESLPIGVWINAKVGAISKDGKHVKSKLGDLALRPGFHSTSIPLADHIGKRIEDGSLVKAKDTVWCEVEISDEIDYNEQARQNGINKNGKFVAAQACLKTLPINGWYAFRTNTMAKVDWYISGAMKITRILTSNEVSDLCKAAGLESQPLEVA